MNAFSGLGIILAIMGSSMEGDGRFVAFIMAGLSGVLAMSKERKEREQK